MFFKQDYNVWCDLRRLEMRLKVRWLTHESDEERWEAYREKHKLPVNDFGPIISSLYHEEHSNDDENRDKFTTGNSFRRSRPEVNNTNGNSPGCAANNNGGQFPFHNDTANSRL